VFITIDGRSRRLKSDIAKTCETLRAVVLVADLSEDGVALRLSLVEFEGRTPSKVFYLHFLL
jgi:hypothetical protein